ncbi:MAG: histidine kinase [Saprospiraceae bacterium]|nr:histidine kinase [Saprospiraceae bacterium]
MPNQNKNRKWNFVLIATLWLASNTLASAQPYAFIPYSISEGLPQSQVYAALCDSRGYLWLGTQGGGVCRFDGLTFETFTTADGLPSNFVQAVYEDSRHHIWIGTQRGFVFFNDQIMVRPKAQPTDLTVFCFWEKDKNSLWLGTSKGVWCYQTDRDSISLEKLDAVIDQTTIYSLFQTKTGLAIGTHRGGYFLRDQRLINLNSKAGLPPNPAYGIAETADGRLWVSCLGEGVMILEESKLSIREVKREKGLERTLCLLAAADGSVWAGTQTDGIFILSAQGGKSVHLTETEGLPHNDVRVLLGDQGRNIWVGMSGGGMARVGYQAFRQYDRDDGLLGTRIYAVLEDARARIWLSAAQSGLQMFDAVTNQWVLRDSGYLQGVKCKTIAADNRGNIWAGSEGRGILVIDSLGRRTTMTRENGRLPANWIRKIVADGSGNMWVATFSDGIVRLTPRDSAGFTTRVFGTRDGLPDAGVTTLQTDRQGNIWFGTASGRVGYFRNGRVEAVFNDQQGLPAVPVSALAFDVYGNCWVATRGAGIFMAPAQAGATFQPIRTPRPLHSQNIYLLVFDRDGNLWAGSENGVDKLVFSSEKREQSAGPVAIKMEEVLHFGANEGFLGIETCQDAGLCDQAGNLWFGTMNGLIRYIPTNRKLEVVAPSLHFQDILLFYKPLEKTPFAAFADTATHGLQEGLELPWNQNHLSFLFKGIDLVHPKQLRYRWKLEGADRDWTPFLTQNQVNYANLAPGEYRLLVQASSDDGLHLSPTLAASLVILKPFWQRWPVQVAVLGGLLGLALLGGYIYLPRLRKAEQLRREKLEVQNRLLQLEQKALQLQMNPHFLFNALNSIQSLISTRDYDTARQEINNFAKLMRGILHNSRRQLISLKEEIDTLEQYLGIEQFCHQNAFSFSTQLAEHLDPEEIELPPMLLQPFVENAVVHGVAPLPYPGEISLHFSLRDEWLICQIQDNGVGREKAALLQEAKKPGHQSVAMQVTRERIEAMGGSLDIADLSGAEGKIAGTLVVVRVPVAINY